MAKGTLLSLEHKAQLRTACQGHFHDTLGGVSHAGMGSVFFSLLARVHI